MKYELTGHAERRMATRKIAPAWVERALLDPDETRLDEEDPTLEHRIYAVADRGGRKLRVVCDPSTLPIRVVTVYFDRSLRGEG